MEKDGAPEPEWPAAPPLLLQSLWGFGGSLAEAIERSQLGGFDGLELNLRHTALAGLKHQ